MKEIKNRGFYMIKTRLRVGFASLLASVSFAGFSTLLGCTVETANEEQSLRSSKITDLWVFGDSYSDTGASVDILPLLRGLKAPPIPENGRMTDDRIWVEILAEKLGFPARAQTFWRSGNPGAGNFSMIAASSAQENLVIMDFPDQVNAFEKKFLRFKPTDLVVVQMGINDAIEAMRVVGRAVDAGRGREAGLAESKAYVASAMKSYTDLVERLATLGARRFLILNLPDLGAAPFARQLQVVPLATGLSVQINQEIARTVEKLRSNRQMTVALLDLFSKVKAVHAQPSAFGLSADLIIDKPCGSRLPPVRQCVEPEKYFYYDLNHPTTPINGLVAEEALSLLR